jgi:hypothetical protein
MNDFCGSSENLISIVNYTLQSTVAMSECKPNAAINAKGDADTTAPDVPSASATPEESGESGGGSSSSDAEKSNDKNDGSVKDSGGEENASAEDDDDAMAEVSDLSDLNRRIYVVTTAGLPWRTGKQ